MTVLKGEDQGAPGVYTTYEFQDLAGHGRKTKWKDTLKIVSPGVGSLFECVEVSEWEVSSHPFTVVSGCEIGRRIAKFERPSGFRKNSYCGEQQTAVASRPAFNY